MAAADENIAKEEKKGDAPVKSEQGPGGPHPNRRGPGGPPHFGGRGGRFGGPPRNLMDVEGPGGENRGPGGGPQQGFGGRGRDGFGGENRPPGGGPQQGFGGRGRRGGGAMRNRESSGPNRTGGGQGPPRNSENSSFLNERLLKTLNGPTTDLPPQEVQEKKFNGRCRLYVGNLPVDITEEEFKKVFASYGETNEVYINKEKNFGFIRLDYRSTAEKAKRELDGYTIRNRNLRVRFAPLGATVKVKNLSPYVTNELLEMAFAVFGEVERAVVNVDDRGNSLREGFVEFSRKNSAQSAIRNCSESCFFLTSSLKPVILEPYEPFEDNDGFSEKCITRKTQDYYQARDVGPRFAKQGSFEHEFGTRWKQIHELYRQKEESLKKEMKLEEEKLEAQLQYAKYEHETEMLRDQLRQREQDRERQKRDWEEKERHMEEQRAAAEESLRRHEEDLSRRMLHQEDELRRRQAENSRFMQETSMRPGGFQGNEPRRYEPMESQRNQEANFMEMGFNRRSGPPMFEGGRGGEPPRIDEMGARRGPPGLSPSQQEAGPWRLQKRRPPPPPQDDFNNKRRRY